MTTRSPSILALALAALLAFTPAGLAQAQQSQQADSLQQLADSLQQTSQRLQRTAQQLEQTARRLQQMNVRMQRQQRGMRRNQQQQGQQQQGQQADTTAQQQGQQQQGQQADTTMRLDTTGQQLANVPADTADTTAQQQQGQQADTTMRLDTTGQQQQGQQQQGQQADTTAQQDTSGQAANRSQQQSDLNATLVAFEQDVTGLDPVMAVGNIDGWMRALRETDDQQLHSIADDLEELKSELRKSSVDGQKVGQLLSTLGQKTTQAASKADPALSPQLLQLGDLLSDAGEQLTSGQGQDQGGTRQGTTGQDTTNQGGTRQDTTRSNQ